MRAPLPAVLALFGGIGWAIWNIASLVGRDWAEGSMAWILILSLLGGIWLTAAATIGLAVVAGDRIRQGVAAIGVLGALIGAVSVLGAYAGIVALPIASAAVLYELGRIGAIGSSTARAHILTAVLALVAIGWLWIPGFLDNPATAVPALSLGELMERPAVFEIVMSLYGLSWITIGWSLLRGRPVATDGMTSGASPA